MSIFLGYGLSLGCVGSGVGMVLGLLFVTNINRIAAVLESITGREVFDPTIYYFQEIPTIIRPATVGWIVVRRDDDRGHGQCPASFASGPYASRGGPTL